MSRDLSAIRRLTPWVLTLALLALVTLAVGRVVTLRSDMQSQVVVELEKDLSDRVARWEGDLTDRLRGLADLGAADPYQATLLQAQMRQADPWFDSLYLWEPAEQITRQGRTLSVNGRMIFPYTPLLEPSEAIRRIPCLARARDYSSLPSTTANQAVQAWRTLCRNQQMPTRMIALSEALVTLKRAQRWDDVIEVLREDGLPSQLTLAEARGQGIPTYRAALLDLQRAEALMALGRDEEAAALDIRLGLEITELDAPEASRLLSLVDFPLLPRINRSGNRPQAQILFDARMRALRRINGFREVREKLLTKSAPSIPESPRYVRDQYGDAPFLLFTHWALDARVGVALQLDQRALLQDFLSSMGRLRKHIIITDTTGTQYIAGSQKGASIEFSVPFSRTLTHLRVGLRGDPVNTRMARLDNEKWLGVGLISLLILLVLASAWGLVNTNRQQRLLLTRQKEFATRVTHELKTPLAGIKVMAENLELGHFGSQHDLESMARSIVREADNLTTRVNEILSVTRERTVRQAEVFDPEEPLFEVIDLWGPRIETGGLAFEADLNPTDELNGDPEAFRDAVACLLDNAIKYHDPIQATPKVWLTLDQDDRDVLVTVRDNGLGVPEEMRDSIFQRFVRVEGDNRGKSGGHGLGLAQVAQIVDDHRGTVTCVESPEGGAQFVIRVPAHSGGLQS